MTMSTEITTMAKKGMTIRTDKGCRSAFDLYALAAGLTAK